MATTPPPPSFLRMPPTPRHGTGYDEYEPYPTRHSARLASQRASTESRTTPPPSFPTSQARTGPRSVRKQKPVDAETLSPPGSPNTSPRKKRSARGVTQSLGNSESSDPFNTTKPSQALHPFRSTMTEGMLPTPAKTPRKKPVDDLGSAARALFPPSTQKKKAKKHTGFSLDSFTDETSQGEPQIQIYTDSRDRIPEVDESESNPFFKKPATNVAYTRPARPKTGSRDNEVNEALDREDGMVYVFRGKKMFRKFTDDAGSDVEDDDDDDLGLLASRPDLIDSSILENPRPLTRSSIKPRVLFPAANDRASQENHIDDADEEAATDIEDHVLADADAADDLDRTTNLHDQQQRPVTPPLNSTVATPPSPGASLRSLRPRAKREGLDHAQTPTAPEAKRKRISPFDGWLRKKQTPPVIGAKAKKRDAETAGSPGGPAPKKTRSNKATVSSS
ncbi:hypothetical protein ARAM_001767 [Aspergillus rambellii]|uniref:Uncharacterized protein n=1 Tax=Aspergillus rambellii TaxID=308745 RepID=A0A0F8WEL5_9EURO|nr:hypothetical protein ARAM_001767 [Aspergillus rambellii]